MRDVQRWAVMLFATAIAGCSGSVADDATAPLTRVSTRPSFSQGGGPVVQSATGAGHFTVADELRTFSFTAVKHADGTVKGEYQLFSRATGARIHGDVVCLSVVGNRAWIGGRQEQASDGFPEGLENGFRVVDNGEGSKDPPDQLSLMFVNAAPGFAQAYCNARPAAPALNPIEGGNIQVRD